MTNCHRVFVRALGLACVWLMLGSAASHAQSMTGAASSQTEVAPQPAKKAVPATRPVNRVKRPPRATAGFEMNPNAKWACNETTVVQPPVWRTKGKITWEFEIRNLGTADLQIRAKGG